MVRGPAPINQVQVAQRSASPSWERWPQPVPQEYTMIDSQGYVQYDPRTAPAQLQRPAVPPQYLIGPAYSSAPMSAMTAPQYHNPGPYAYGPYPSPPPTTPMTSPFKEELSDRPSTRLMQSHGSRPLSYVPETKNCQEFQMLSPATRRSSVASSAACYGSSKSTAASKTVSFNETIDPADQVDFSTDVDELMKVLQRDSDERDEEPQPLTPALSPKSESTLGGCNTERMAEAMHPPNVSKTKKAKKHVCDGPNCNKAFVQKTHMEIHRRTHTGDRPYQCAYKGCGLQFTQRGNLKTHERRHVGDKPYVCEQCQRAFAQRGNLRSHRETHNGLKPFSCRLDGCTKTFSQLGNMKTHQNNFHKETLRKLTGIFVEFAQKGTVPDEHRDLLEYFRQHYKNSNKGIKGRGKGRVVSRREVRMTATASKIHLGSSEFAPPPPSGPQDVNRMPAYAWQGSQAGMMGNVARTQAYSAHYGMFGPEQAQHTNPDGLYDEHSRPMSFHDRYY